MQFYSGNLRGIVDVAMLQTLARRDDVAALTAGYGLVVVDTVFLAAPIAFKGRLVQYVGRILRPYPGKDVVEVHDYHDTDTGVLASSLTKRAAGYTSLGFPDPRRLQHRPPDRA